MSNVYKYNLQVHQTTLNLPKYSCLNCSSESYFDGDDDVVSIRVG